LPQGYVNNPVITYSILSFQINQENYDSLIIDDTIMVSNDWENLQIEKKKI
jgi:hypothetical protein